MAGQDPSFPRKESIMALKAKTVTREMVKILALGMEEGGEAAAKALPPVYAGDAPD